MSTRGKPSADSPLTLARNLGLAYRGGEQLTWLSLLDLAVSRYWQLRTTELRAVTGEKGKLPVAARPTTKGAA